MKSNALPRREWIKKGLLSIGALAVTPQILWANRVNEAISSKRRFLFNTSGFNEFTPPKFPDLDNLKARLMWNENPYGPSKEAAQAFTESVWKGNHYPSNSLDQLTEKIAMKEGVSKDQVLLGPGSSDLLEKTAVVLFQNGGNVVSADPSYMALISVAKAAGGNWKSIKLTSTYEHDLDAMEAAIDESTKLVYITNPNNPTATITNADKLQSFCKRVSENLPVFIDEAYMELSENGMADSMAPLVAEGKNILVSRTFSKIHGMAGLRIGYLLGQKEILNQINDVTGTGMGITGPSIAAATANLDNEEFLSDCRERFFDTRTYFKNYLTKRGISHMPSQTNFIIFPLEMAGDEFLQQVYDRNMAVRAFQFWGKDWCRVSMGTMEEMQLFTEALDEILV